MLNFYLIRDDQARPNSPEQLSLQFVGALGYDTFERLKSKSIIDERFDYHTDFRWGTSIIKQITNRILQLHLQDEQEAKELYKLVQLAERNNSGLIAYAD